MAEKILIICPNCRTKLSFMSVPNWQDKLVECPHCKFKAKANVYQSGDLGKGGQGADDADTELPTDFHPSKDNEIGVIKLKESGRAFQLKMGTNILGRVAESGKADLKISTDPYMSRSHLRIDVVEAALGIEHRLVEIGAKNNIILNGHPIQRGDILKLNYGDEMTLGKTIVVFDRSKEDDAEATQLV